MNQHMNEPDVGVVVGAAIIRMRRVLAVRRKTPAELAGRWEFPGGKVEAGEFERTALARECREELRVTVAVGHVLGRASINERLDLVLYAATLISGEPAADIAHDALRWLAAAELTDVDWLDADNKLVPAVERSLLGQR